MLDQQTFFNSAATNDFEKDFFKLMNNSVFGKNDGEHQET